MKSLRELADKVVRLDGKATKGPWDVSLDRRYVITPNGVIGCSVDSVELIAHYRSSAPRLARALLDALDTLEKIYKYRSDKPDWNMVMAIAGSIVEPVELVTSNEQ